MKRLKRYLSVLLAVVLVLGLPVSASAAEDRIIFPWDEPADEVDVSTLSLREYANQLEEKYDIAISYDVDTLGNASIGTDTLDMMDTLLGYVTPSVVRQVSAHFQQKLGRRLSFVFNYTPFRANNGVELVGLFEEHTARVYLFMPYSSQGTFTTGAAPITIVHEFAHALFVACEDVVGRNTLEQEWRALNGGVGYNGGSFSEFDQTVFVSSYGATSYEEDFAEVFAHAFVRVNAGQGIQGLVRQDGTATALGNKVLYMERLLQRVFTDTDQAVSNMHRAFSTPAAISYEGVTLSGDDLQYMGFSAPRYVMQGVIDAYGFTAASSTWVSAIGGWRVTSTSGAQYAIFPGGYLVVLSQANAA